jgi:hypothetical protein
MSEQKTKADLEQDAINAVYGLITLAKWIFWGAIIIMVIGFGAMILSAN